MLICGLVGLADFRFGFVFRLHRNDLKVIGLAGFAKLALIPKLAKNELVEFVKGFGWIEFAAAP